MKNHYLKDRNIEVYVGPATFKNWGRFMKYKNELDESELKELKVLLTCIKKLPTKIGQVILNKYYKLAKFDLSKDKRVKHTDEIIYRYKIKPAQNIDVAELLNLTAKEVGEIDNKAHELLAEYMLKEKLKQHKLIQVKKNYRSVINNSDVNQIIEKYRSNYVDVSYEVKNLSDNYCEVSIEYFEEIWVEK